MVVEPVQGRDLETYEISPNLIETDRYDAGPGVLVIECVVASPKSQVGNTVWLQIPVEQVPALMRAARSSAIEVRGGSV